MADLKTFGRARASDDDDFGYDKSNTKEDAQSKIVRNQHFDEIVENTDTEQTTSPEQSPKDKKSFKISFNFHLLV